MNLRRIIVASSLVAVGCSAQAVPTIPTRTEPLKSAVMPYDINVPDPITATLLNQQYPSGVALSPIEAQARFDFTDAYHGSPNVYYGEFAPKGGIYDGTGIVVAPRSVASMRTFRAGDWPGLDGLEANTVYTWTGTFRYAKGF